MKNNLRKHLDFISETKEGKFTDATPQEVDIILHRIEIQEQEFFVDTEECQEDNLLFGITY